MRPSDGMDEIRITAPVPGTCPVCATKHDERDPHDRDSLYYQNQFFKANKRFPSWRDAMSHCTDMTKIENAEVLNSGVVEVTFLIDHTVSGNITVTGVELYDHNGVRIGSKAVSIARADATEGILYVCRFQLFQVTENTSNTGAYDAL